MSCGLGFTPILLTIYACTNAYPVCTVTCEKCEHGRAYFYQLQIRSADEPMTTCKHFSLRLFPVIGSLLFSVSELCR